MFYSMSTRVRTLLLSALLLLWLLPTAVPEVANAQDAVTADSTTRFTLTPTAKFLNCFAQYPGDPQQPPIADVKVQKGKVNDKMTLRLRNFKPGLAFDLFTVERTPFLADGSPNPGFTNFGFAWYQSDIEIGKNGGTDVEINTILLNQIFGFDPDAGLGPTNTFHVGFWFNNPADAAPCGFDVNNPTPFNGEHRAGPLAMASVPNATTNLGPLCINPNTSTNPVSCNP